MARKRDVHQMYRATGFIKKPSVRCKLKQAKLRAESIRNKVADYDDRYTVIDENGQVHNYIDKASEKHFGIFNKRGYRALKLFHTREEAEIELSTWKRPDFYDIREIEWFEEDKEK